MVVSRAAFLMSQIFTVLSIPAEITCNVGRVGNIRNPPKKPKKKPPKKPTERNKIGNQSRSDAYNRRKRLIRKSDYNL
jgi:hypothetical protein